jgi:DNA (cytosine-5)-methyltransferase 1
MDLYQEIIFLDTFFNGKYCVENVIPFYQPLIPAKKRGRHLYWTNFNLPNSIKERKNPELSRGLSKDIVLRLSKYHDYNFRKYKGKQDIRKIARNLVDYEAGKIIFETMLGIMKQQNVKQNILF